jgi:GT2 family glycosyltransferase
VAVIVLNYNGLHHLEYSLPSIMATDYANLEIVLVDNASLDESVAYVQESFPQVTIITSSGNLGWSGGNNLGIKYALQKGAAYIVLANNDIRVDPRWIHTAVGVAQDNRRVGVIGYEIIDARGSDSVSQFEQAKATWHELRVEESLVAGGMAFFARAEMFRRIGVIDEGFFAYAEDNDLVIRARKAGYQILRISVPVWHRGQGSFGSNLLWAAKLQIRNNLRLAIKHENLGGILYQVARHWAKASLPGLRVDPLDNIARRLRPSNIFVNFALVMYAIGWNILQLPATLRRRRQDYELIESARRLWTT